MEVKDWHLVVGQFAWRDFVLPVHEEGLQELLIQVRAISEHLIVDGSRGSPLTVASFLGCLQAEQACRQIKACQAAPL